MTILTTNRSNIAGTIRGVGELLTLAPEIEAEAIVNGQAVYIGRGSSDEYAFQRTQPGNRSGMLGGDSLANQAWGTVGTPTNFWSVSCEGAHEWGNALSGRRLNIFHNIAVGGKTARDVMREQVPVLKKLKPAYAVLSMGHNDIYNDLVSGRVCAMRVTDVVKSLLDDGITPIWSTIWARQYSASYLSAHLEANDRMKIFADDCAAGIFWDGFEASVDSASSTCEGTASWFYTPQATLIHNNNLGGYWIGKDFGYALSQRLPPSQIMAFGAQDATNTAGRSNILANVNFTGTGGTGGTGVTGSVPTGWKVNWATRLGDGSAAISLVDVPSAGSARNIAKALRLTITSSTTGIANGDEIRIQQDTGLTTLLRGGDIILPQCMFRLASPNNVELVRMRVQTNANEATWWGTSQFALAALPEGFTIPMRARPMVVFGSGNPSAANYEVRVRFQGSGANNGNGTVIDMWAPQLRDGL